MKSYKINFTPNLASTLFYLLWLAALGFPLAARAEESVSLAGKWRFALDDAKKGETAKWYTGELKPSAGQPTEIALPGSTDQAKAGHPNPEKPSLMGLYRPYVYTGPAWYQREIEIPADWQGKQVTLFLERNHWTNHVWLDDRDCGTQDSLIAPQLFDLGHVTPGKHRLTICVDNTLKYNLGPFPSINYEGTQTNWNGIVGAIELRAADPVAITHLEVYPDLAGKKVKVVATVANRTGAAANGQLQLSVADADGKTQGSPATAAYSSSEAESTVTAEVPMGDDFKTWDEFAPNLYTVKAVLAADPSRSEQTVSFGMRQLTIQDKKFVMNGRPLLLRGTLEDAVFPLTAYPSMDVPAWRRIFQIEKSYGLNFMRCHSWCPPEAAFAAADLEGVMLQAEGPDANIYYGDQPREAFITKELLRMVRTYGNHPSFCLMTLGNECEFATPELGKIPAHMLELLVQADPRHFYASASGGKVVPSSQWTEGGIDFPIVPATTWDAGPALAKHDIPMIVHEVGQWAVYPNLDEMKKYTGVLEPKNFQIVKDDLAAKGMLDQAHAFFEATGRQAALLYKSQIEDALRTPGLPGFSLLDLHDYPGQGTALVGILDPFWDSKGLVTPEEHHRYAGAVVPLIRLSQRAYTTQDTLTAPVQLSQFGPAALAQVKPVWTIQDAGGREIASGTLPAVDAPVSRLDDLGTITASLAKAQAPCKATVTVSLAGTPYSNRWDIWIYPPPAPVAAPAGIVISRTWEEARAALAAGKNVVLFPRQLDRRESFAGSFKPVYWSPVWCVRFYPNTMGILCDPKHPLFAQFPTDFFSDWQWYDLANKSRSLILDETPAGFRPLVQVIDNFARNHRFGTVLEAKVGPGQLLVCTLPVADDPKDPAALQFLRSLYAYVGSSAFRPSQPLDVPTLDKLFHLTPPHLKSLGVTVTADSEAPGHPASAAIDDEPRTFWQSEPKAGPNAPPHYLILDLGKEMTVKGLTYMPRQDGWDGHTAKARIYCSDHPDAWGTPFAIDLHSTNTLEQKFPFPKPVRCRYVKFEAFKALSDNPLSALAEIDLDLGEP
jgi:hypothetical protein